MCDRKLRSGTKKNYKEMADGVSRDKSESADSNNSESEDYACVGNKNVNKQQQHRTSSSGDILNHELALSHSSHSEQSNDESDYDPSVESEDDDDLKEAELQLQLMKKQQRDLLKKSKRARIERETEEVRRSLEVLKKSSNAKRGKKVNAASLRAMDEVVDEVDRLMDRHMNIKAGRACSDVESDVVSVRSNSSVVKKKKVVERERHSETKLVSGKSKNSLNSDVKFPQKWPHSFLNPLFVSSKEKNYEDLSISEFCAGYMTILENEECEQKKAFRTAHLKELMYLSTRFRWRCVLDYHGACLTEIERGHLRWGESFQFLQTTTLSGGFIAANSRGGASAGGLNRSDRGGEGTVFCKGYQRGTCHQTRDHYGQFMGQNRLLRHICGNCWIHLKVHANHPETSDECPVKGVSMKDQ